MSWRQMLVLQSHSKYCGAWYPSASPEDRLPVRLGSSKNIVDCIKNELPTIKFIISRLIKGRGNSHNVNRLETTFELSVSILSRNKLADLAVWRKLATSARIGLEVLLRLQPSSSFESICCPFCFGLHGVFVNHNKIF